MNERLVRNYNCEFHRIAWFKKEEETFANILYEIIRPLPPQLEASDEAISFVQHEAFLERS